MELVEKNVLLNKTRTNRLTRNVNKNQNVYDFHISNGKDKCLHCY